MACYYPVTLFKSLAGASSKSGKTPLRGIVNGGDPNQPVLVPCSRCIGCRLERSRQWAIRCIHEAQMHQKNCFITLTYNDENMTYGGDAYTLFPRDLQLFLKRLRKKYGNGIRFFACGEYGDRLGRPHYHACIFGHDFEDKKFFSSKNGINLYISESLASLWPYGFSTIGDVTFESAAYVARYMMKKKLGKNAVHYKKVGIAPEFVRMSRRPGIGTSWYDKYKGDIFPHDYAVIRGGIKTRPPKFYGNKYEIEKPDEMITIKKRRENEALKRANDNTKKRLKTKEFLKKQQIKQLIRNLS